tara:strand:- start:96 stop:425 length:330 start_codon:yes stop_codon:yes gene_type:complete
MMRNIHFFNLAPGADEKRVLELWDGPIAEFALARGCLERRTLKLHDARYDSGTGADAFEPAQFMNESLWPDLAAAEACWSQDATEDFTAARAELEPMVVMVGGMRYNTP